MACLRVTHAVMVQSIPGLDFLSIRPPLELGLLQLLGENQFKRTVLIQCSPEGTQGR